jgi:hypothetical protein
MAPFALVVSGLMAVLMLFGMGAIEKMVSERMRKRRALRWRTRKAKQVEWFAQLRSVNRDMSSWDLEMIYWDGIDLRDSFTTGGDSAKLQADERAVLTEKQTVEDLLKMFSDHRVKKLNEALVALEKAMDSKLAKD